MRDSRSCNIPRILLAVRLCTGCLFVSTTTGFSSLIGPEAATGPVQQLFPSFIHVDAHSRLRPRPHARHTCASSSPSTGHTKGVGAMILASAPLTQEPGKRFEASQFPAVPSRSQAFPGFPGIPGIPSRSHCSQHSQPDPLVAVPAGKTIWKNVARLRGRFVCCFVSGRSLGKY